MTAPTSPDPRADFEHFSNEYAQALQAYTAIENQASTLLLMGHTDELRQFIEQFIEMSSRTRAAAAEKGETNFVEWFDELIRKAETLRSGVAQ
jgi:hypothetical protein